MQRMRTRHQISCASYLHQTEWAFWKLSRASQHIRRSRIVAPLAQIVLPRLLSDRDQSYARNQISCDITEFLDRECQRVSSKTQQKLDRHPKSISSFDLVVSKKKDWSLPWRWMNWSLQSCAADDAVLSALIHLLTRPEFLSVSFQTQF